MWVWYRIEDWSGGQWSDRANVHVVEGATHTLLVPSAGRAYNASGSGALCHIGSDPGWAGVGTSWTETRFDLSPWAGREIRLEIHYDTDPAEICEGFYVDEIRIDDVLRHACDGMRCGNCLVSALGSQSALKVGKALPDGASFAWQDPLGGALEYHLNSVASRMHLGAVDPQSPRQGVGQGTIRCAVPSPGCTDPVALRSTERVLYYQALAACGPSGADEGPP